MYSVLGLKMRQSLFRITFLVGLALLSQRVNAQGTNLLQRYIKQYFKDYYPSTVRSYTLYGNGQNGPADIHAGLPYGYDANGKVKSCKLYGIIGIAEPLI